MPYGTDWRHQLMMPHHPGQSTSDDEWERIFGKHPPQGRPELAAVPKQTENQNDGVADKVADALGAEAPETVYRTEYCKYCGSNYLSVRCVPHSSECKSRRRVD